MGPMVVRSSLELMLDAIRQRDERPEGAPPALPSRPTSRGRLPSARRPLLPLQLKDVPGLVRCDRREEKKVLVLKSRLGTEALYAKMPELECYEEGSSPPEGPGSPQDENLGCAVADQVLSKIALEEDVNPTMEGILWAQKRIRGHQARHNFQELKGGATVLQSFVRGERARVEFEYRTNRWKAVVLIQKHAKRWIARRTFDGRRKDFIILQSVVRGWLARKQFKLLKNLKVPELCHMEVKGDQGKNLQEMQDTRNEHPELCPLVLAELQRRVLLAEAALRIKEEENLILQEQVQQYETRWSDSEAKMKYMEVAWQKKLTSLQMSLAEAKKSLSADDMAKLERPDVSPGHHYFDSEDTMSAETHTTECTPTKQARASVTPESTPTKQARSSGHKLSRNSDGTRNSVSNLVKEFEQRRKAFENKAGFLIDVKSGKLDPLMDPYEELQKLRVRVAAWQKDYKVRLQETTLALQKLRNPGSDKAHRKWWAIGCAR